MTERIGVDRHLGGWSLIAAILLAWPLILFGRPAYMSDSLSYYRGGHVAWEFIQTKLDVLRAPATSEAGAPANAGSAARPESKGARSILYSAAAYVLGAPAGSMAMLAIAQALAGGLGIAVLASVTGVKRSSQFVVVAIVAAFATTLAPVAAYIVPDIFAGLIVVVTIVLVGSAASLSIPLRLLLVALGAFAVTSHASHPPLAAALAIVGVGWCWWRGDRGRVLAGSVIWITLPLFLGALATVASGKIGFGEASVAPKRFPLTLARSIEDGPGRWYLERHCKERHYTVCSLFPAGLPRTVPAFLWGKDGLSGRATPEQMDQIRVEEPEIVLAAAREFARAQTHYVVRNIAVQLVTFDLHEIAFDHRITMDRSGELAFAATPMPARWVLSALEWLSRAAALAAIVGLAWGHRRLDRQSRGWILLLLTGLVANAVICAVFSGVAGRYQARVIWVLPVLALLILLRERQPRSEQP